jgi:hypothetical protein
LPPREQLEGMDTLVKEEFVTAEDFDSSRLSILQECGFNGRINRIAYPFSARQLNVFKCIAPVSNHAEWRAVDQAIRTGVLERWCDETSMRRCAFPSCLHTCTHADLSPQMISRSSDDLDFDY